MSRSPFTPRISPLAIGAAVTFIALLAGGGAHRYVDRLLIDADATPVALARPLSELPLQVGPWRGVDLPMDERVIEVAGSDDEISRRYVDESAGRSVDLYVAYAARPAKMLSHRPQVCYPAHGWMHVETRAERLDVPDGGGFDVLVHRFSRDEPAGETVVVLNYYILRGRYVTDWREFWGPTWRLPNLRRDPSFYVLQVQVSTRAGVLLRVEDAAPIVRDFAARLAPQVEKCLPSTTEQ